MKKRILIISPFLIAAIAVIWIFTLDKMIEVNTDPKLSPFYKPLAEEYQKQIQLRFKGTAPARIDSEERWRQDLGKMYYLILLSVFSLTITFLILGMGYSWVHRKEAVLIGGRHSVGPRVAKFTIGAIGILLFILLVLFFPSVGQWLMLLKVPFLVILVYFIGSIGLCLSKEWGRQLVLFTAWFFGGTLFLSFLLLQMDNFLKINACIFTIFFFMTTYVILTHREVKETFIRRTKGSVDTQDRYKDTVKDEFDGGGL